MDPKDVPRVFRLDILTGHFKVFFKKLTQMKELTSDWCFSTGAFEIIQTKRSSIKKVLLSTLYDDFFEAFFGGIY